VTVDIVGAFVRSEVEGAIVARATVREKPRRPFVRRKDPVEASELRSHVRHGETEIRGEVLERITHVLHAPLHRRGVSAEITERLEDDVLAGQTEGEPSPVVDLNRLRHLDPRLSQNHGDAHVGPPESDRERADPPMARRVRVGANDRLTRLDEIAIELCVHDRFVRVEEVREARLFRKVPRQLDELLRPLIVRERARIDRVVERQVEVLAAEDLRAAQLLVGRVHAVPGELRSDRPVDLDPNRLPGFHPGSFEPHAVVTEDLLRQGHRFRRGSHGSSWRLDCSWSISGSSERSGWSVPALTRPIKN
jgi:hypothetical protein